MQPRRERDSHAVDGFFRDRSTLLSLLLPLASFPLPSAPRLPSPVTVNRLICSSDNGLDMVLDINSQLYKLELGDKFSLMLASTLNLDGTPDANEYNQSGEASLADNYEYVMHGKVFKVQQAGNEGKMEVFTSYGGLLMSLKGQPSNLNKIELDQRMYLLIKKIGA